MVKLGVISQVTEPTEWCAGMVPVVKRHSSVRVCVDLTHLNQSVKTERHQLPSDEQVCDRLLQLLLTINRRTQLIGQLKTKLYKNHNNIYTKQKDPEDSITCAIPCASECSREIHMRHASTVYTNNKVINAIN